MYFIGLRPLRTAVWTTESITAVSRYSALADREHAGIFYHFDLADRTFRRIVRHGDVPVLEKEEVMAHLVEAVGDGAVLGRPVLSAVFCGQLKIPVDERLHLRLSSLPPLLRGEGLQPPFRLRRPPSEA